MHQQQIDSDIKVMYVPKFMKRAAGFSGLCRGTTLIGKVTQMRQLHGKASLSLGNHPLSPSPSLASLLIPIEKEKGRLRKQERMMGRRGAAEQAKGSTDIHGNLRLHSAVIISIFA